MRPRLATAALTILRGYILAGRPNQKLSPFGSFEGWSDLVRSSLVWVGLPDPAEATKRLDEEADTEGGAIAQLLAGWQELLTGLKVDCCTASTALHELESRPSLYGTLREGIAHLCDCGRASLPSAAKLGCALRSVKGRNVGGWRLMTGAKAGGVNTWRVEKVEEESP